LKQGEFVVVDFMNEAKKEVTKTFRDLSKCPTDGSKFVTAQGHAISASVCFILGMSQKVLGELYDGTMEVFKTSKPKDIPTEGELAKARKQRFKKIKIKSKSELDEELERKRRQWQPDSEPKAYKDPQPGERYERIKCVHTCCEGDGYFVLSEGQWRSMQEKGLSKPRACYPCRKWVWNISRTDVYADFCEECGYIVYRHSEATIMHHKYSSIPPARKTCTNKVHKRSEAERKKLEVKCANDRQLSLRTEQNHYEAVDEPEGFMYKERGYENNPHLRDIDRELIKDPKFNIPFSGQMVRPISEPDDFVCEIVTSSYMFYKRHWTYNEDGERESYLQHIQNHITGWESAVNETRDKKPYLKEFVNAENVIHHAYQIVGKYDPHNESAHYLGWYESNNRGGHDYIKLDVVQGIKYIFAYWSDSHYEGWFLKTAFRSGDPTKFSSHVMTAKNLAKNRL
jgi:hypothetical protein